MSETETIKGPDLSQILPDLINIVNHVVGGAEALTPILGVVFPGATKIVDILNGVLSLAQDIDGAITEGKIISTTDDQAELTAIIDALMVKADELGGKVADS